MDDDGMCFWCFNLATRTLGVELCDDHYIEELQKLGWA